MFGSRVLSFRKNIEHTNYLVGLQVAITFCNQQALPYDLNASAMSYKCTRERFWRSRYFESATIVSDIPDPYSELVHGYQANDVRHKIAGWI